MHFCLDVVTVCRWEKKFRLSDERGLPFGSGLAISKCRVSKKAVGKRRSTEYVQKRELSGQCGMENCFGLLKSELLYLRTFQSLDEFCQELVAYLEYYNHDRMKAKLNGLSPVQYRI